LLFSDGSTLERDALILTGDQCTLRSILSTAALEGSNRTMFRKLVFMFGDTTSDIDQ